MPMKLFIILGNQLFNPKYLSDYKDHIFFMAEDYGLCTFEKHHKLKILLFLRRPKIPASPSHNIPLSAAHLLSLILPHAP